VIYNTGAGLNTWKLTQRVPAIPRNPEYAFSLLLETVVADRHQCCGVAYHQSSGLH